MTLKGKALNGQNTSQDASDMEAKPDSSAPSSSTVPSNPESKPLEPTAPKPEEKEAVVVPRPVSGTYLNCPLIEQTPTTAQIACNFADKVTNETVPFEALYKSGDFKVVSTVPVQISIVSLPSTAAWTQLVTLSFDSKEQRDASLPHITVEFSGITLDDMKFGTATTLDPAKPARVRAIRNIRPSDASFIGYQMNADGTVKTDASLMTYFNPSGLSTAWEIGSGGRMRNPLGFCARYESSAPNIRPVPCDSGMATQFEWSGDHIRISSSGNCLQVFSLTTAETNLPVPARYSIGVAHCDEDDNNQKFDIISYEAKEKAAANP